jgi:hypothetical protein
MDALQLQRNRSALLRTQRATSRAAALARRKPLTETEIWPTCETWRLRQAKARNAEITVGTIGRTT